MNKTEQEGVIVSHWTKKHGSFKQWGTNTGTPPHIKPKFHSKSVSRLTVVNSSHPGGQQQGKHIVRTRHVLLVSSSGVTYSQVLVINIVYTSLILFLYGFDENFFCISAPLEHPLAKGSTAYSQQHLTH